MCSGVEPSENLSGAPYIQLALSKTLGGFGPIFITIAMMLFAFTTLLGNLYYVNQSFSHILGHVPGKKFNYVYYILASAMILLGAGLNADFLWNLADLTMGLMAVINVPVILFLSRYAIGALKDYYKQKKEGKQPEFKAKDIGLKDKVDYWQ
jgi:AGCS family alanine or glycine:cation symporter